MRKAWIAAACVLSLYSPTAVSRAAEQADDRVTLPDCLVSLIEEAQVSAQEAGVLVKLDVREGQSVGAGDQLARIDDARSLLAKNAAEVKLLVTQERANSDVDIRYSKAAAEVAKAEYEQALRVNERTANTITDTEVRRLLLAARKAILAIEQAELEHRVESLEVRVQKAEVAATDEEIRRRQVNSPLEGVVVEVHRHAGEWVQPGDPVARVVRMDRLRIEGYLPAADKLDENDRVIARGYAPQEVDDRAATVTVRLAAGRRESFQGKVVFVSPLVEAGGEYRVWAEVDNRKEAGHWLLRPGLMGQMTIHLK